MVTFLCWLRKIPMHRYVQGYNSLDYKISNASTAWCLKLYIFPMWSLLSKTEARVMIFCFIHRLLFLYDRGLDGIVLGQFSHLHLIWLITIVTWRLSRIVCSSVKVIVTLSYLYHISLLDTEENNIILIREHSRTLFWSYSTPS